MNAFQDPYTPTTSLENYHTQRTLMDQYSQGPRARLTCETCKERKVKCDKLRPCTSCHRAGIHCVAVERARLPRGRSAKKKKRLQETPAPRPQMSNLYNRVSMLESILHDLLNSRTESSSALVGLEDSTLPSVDPPCGDATNLVAGAPSLNHDNEQADDRSNLFINQLPIDNSRVTTFDAGFGVIEDTPNVLSTRMLQIYMAQVNPIFPVLQCSSLWKLTVQRGRYHRYTTDHPAPKALAYAISYMTFTTLSNEQCSLEFNMSRDILLGTHHCLTQYALEQADYINTDDLTVLQAFVLFLIAMQAHDQSRKAWTMLSLAIRIAQSVSLDKADPPFVVPVSDRQTRQRLWHLISLLDVQASFDRGSAPILHANCLQSHVFPTVDFLDFFTPPDDQSSLAPGPTSLADPTFIVVMAEAQRAFRSLDVSDVKDACMVDNNTSVRLQIAGSFQQNSQKILKDSQPLEIPLHSFLTKIVDVTHRFLQLVAVQPVQGAPNSYFSQDVISQSTSLTLAIQFLQSLNELYRDPQIEPFRWYTRLFVPWHAFSVAMDQVCACGDAPLRGYYQSLITGLYSSLQELLGDAHRNLLQRPLHRFALLSETCMTQAVGGDSLVEPSLLQLC